MLRLTEKLKSRKKSLRYQQARQALEEQARLLREQEEERLRKEAEEAAEALKNNNTFYDVTDSDIDTYLDRLVEDGSRAADPAELLPLANYGEVANDVVHLGPGSSFGEQALLNDKPRQATIKCI